MSKSINLYKQLANHKLFNKSVNFGLKRIKLALNLLENPERKLTNIISVIGESGKFTTLFSLKSFLLISVGPQKPQKLTTWKIKYEKVGPKILIPRWKMDILMP